MSSSSRGNDRPQGNHRIPRKGGRTLTKRLIRIEAERRSEIDLHYLGQALLRLAQEQYERERATNRPATPRPDRACERAREPHTGLNGAPRGPRRSAPPARPEGAKG